MESPPVIGMITLDCDEMNGVFVTDENFMQNFVGGNLKEQDCSKMGVLQGSYHSPSSLLFMIVEMS